MYHVSAQGVDERMHDKCTLLLLLLLCSFREQYMLVEFKQKVVADDVNLNSACLWNSSKRSWPMTLA